VISPIDTFGLVLEPIGDYWPRLMIVSIYRQDSAYRAALINLTSMKIKLTYPKIPDTLDCPLKQCVAFEKYDGTNIHWVLNPKSGWVEFGTRRDRFPFDNKGITQFEQAHPELAGIENVWDINAKLEFFLLEHPQYSQAKQIIVFTEYLGSKSFAGLHLPGDPMHLVIIDVQVDDKILPPEEFIKEFGQFPIAQTIFKGKFTGQLFVDVRKGKYPVKEGVVVKGMVGDQVYMAKIKTEAYLQRLQSQFKDDWKNYWE
jgi:hypothetical protein